MEEIEVLVTPDSNVIDVLYEMSKVYDFTGLTFRITTPLRKGIKGENEI